MSKYTGPVTADRWAAAKADHGIGLAIVGSWHGRDANPHCEATLVAAADAGLAVATYIVINSDQGAQPVWYGAVACGDMWPRLSFAALDIEIDGVTETALAIAEKSLRDGNQRPIIYSGRWFWSAAEHLGDPTWCKHLPLWDSRYDGRQELHMQNPYGGWTDETLVGKQFEGTNQTLGFECDLSVFDGDWLSKHPRIALRADSGPS